MRRRHSRSSSFAARQLRNTALDSVNNRRGDLAREVLGQPADGSLDRLGACFNHLFDHPLCIAAADAGKFGCLGEMTAMDSENPIVAGLPHRHRQLEILMADML